MNNYYVKDLVTPFTFAYWGGAVQTVKLLTEAELIEVWDNFFDACEGTPTRTEINDFLWFDTDTIAEILGYHDFDELYTERTRTDGKIVCNR